MIEQLQQNYEHTALTPVEHQALGGLSIEGVVQGHIAEAANYQGNWMQAQQTRMESPDFKAKYSAMVDSSLLGLRDGEPDMLGKPAHYISFHQDLVDSFDANRERVYSAVGYGPAQDYNKKPRNTGVGNIRELGTVFSDAVNQEGAPLTDRQKDIIAAHEAYHGMVTLPSPAYPDMAKGFDWEVQDKMADAGEVSTPMYLKQPDELLARMAQLKNYFGQQSGEAFTKAHLDYARDHYVEDTGLDNSMALMFRIVTSDTEPDFLRLMNELPV